MIGSEARQLERFTFSEIQQWDDDTFYELFNGVPVAMSAPLSRHQAILSQFFLRLGNFLEGRRCKVYPAPYAVLLDADDNFDGEIMFLPDIAVVCDASKRHEKGCKGAPDLIIEILSPSTRKSDKITKKQLYEKFGVPEYWIVDPDTRMVDVYLQFNGRYVISSYTDEDILPVVVLPGCEIDLKAAFDAAEE